MLYDKLLEKVVGRSLSVLSMCRNQPINLVPVHNSDQGMGTKFASNLVDLMLFMYNNFVQPWIL